MLSEVTLRCESAGTISLTVLPLTMNNYSLTIVVKMQEKATRFLKRWLHLPHYATPSIISPLGGFSLPYLLHLAQKATLKSLTTISSLIDPLISELAHCQDIVMNSLYIPDQNGPIFSPAVRLVSKILLIVVRQSRRIVSQS